MPVWGESLQKAGSPMRQDVQIETRLKYKI